MIIFMYVAQHPSRHSLLQLRKALPITKHLLVLQDTLRPEIPSLLDGLLRPICHSHSCA